MSINGPSKIVREGLVLSLDAGNIKSYASGSTNWYDLTKINGASILTNGPTFSNVNGGTIVYDGVDDKVVTTAYLSTLGITNEITFETWFSTTTTTQFAGIICSRDPGGLINGIGLNPYGNVGIRVDIKGNLQTYPSQAISTYNVLTGGWFHLIVTYSASLSIINIFINGVLDASGGANQGTLDTTPPFTIGLDTASSSRYFSGKIPVVKIYNRALSANEVLKNFNATRTRFGV